MQGVSGKAAGSSTAFCAKGRLIHFLCTELCQASRHRTPAVHQETHDLKYTRYWLIKYIPILWSTEANKRLGMMGCHCMKHIILVSRACVCDGQVTRSTPVVAARTRWIFKTDCSSLSARLFHFQAWLSWNTNISEHLPKLLDRL